MLRFCRSLQTLSHLYDISKPWKAWPRAFKIWKEFGGKNIELGLGNKRFLRIHLIQGRVVSLRCCRAILNEFRKDLMDWSGQTAHMPQKALRPHRNIRAVLPLLGGPGSLAWSHWWVMWVSHRLPLGLREDSEHIPSFSLFYIISAYPKKT